MLFNGDVWLNYEGALIAINYQSQIEAKKKEELIAVEKHQLHKSINDFKKPVLILETGKYRIRIDDMGQGNYRYCSWKLESKMSDKANLIIQKGEYTAEGSGGNHSFSYNS